MTTKIDLDKSKKQYSLIDKNGYTTHIMSRIDEKSDQWNIFTVISWVCDEKNTVSEKEFLASCYIKRDGCSHWHFYGEDGYTITEGGNSFDAYYHICGFSDYMNFIIGILFAFKVVSEINPDFIKDEKEEFKQWEHLLSDYTILDYVIEE